MQFYFALNPPQLVSSAKWDFGDGTTGTGIPTSHIYQNTDSHTVSAQVQNGVCSFTPEKVVVKSNIQVLLQLAQLEYCNNDQVEYKFTASPTGGKLTTDDVQKNSIKPNADGSFSFLPGKVVIPTGAKDVTVTYTYTFGGKTQTINVKVEVMPQVRIMVKQENASPTNNIQKNFRFTIDPPNQITDVQWVFGDGTTGSGVEVVHSYQTAGSFTVVATIKNGVCSTTLSTVVSQNNVG
jgi:PKD repeat protein